ncbi:MAG TPA: hypothetical protein VNC61_04610 [Acidimicrobiales bacterium]|nr:hypothetical protein [Acidimicrobiales bacterium]
MIRALVVLIVGLALPGALPALAVVRRSPVIIFLAPFIGATMAAVAAELELGTNGSLVMWYVIIAVATNMAVAAWWLVTRSSLGRDDPPWTWFTFTAVVMLGAMIVPLTGLRAPMLGYDVSAIWLPHTLMVSGGHQAMLSGLQNVTTANPDYPPLVPAAGALAFAFFGRGDLYIAELITVLLNACALGIVGMGIAAVGSKGSLRLRLIAIVVAGTMCMVGFAVAGDYAVDGYTDLLWSAAALGAVIWGLVLPRSNRAFITAWICVAVASLTKNEGLTAALIVLVLITLRYRPLALVRFRRSTRHPENRDNTDVRTSMTIRGWAERAAFILVPALPGLAWDGLAREVGLKNAFFGAPSTESPGARFGPAIDGITSHLLVLPIAVAVFVAGSALLRRDRELNALGHAAWLWMACLLYLSALLATYLFGSLEIHWWLRNSVDRTTIFPQIALYTDLSIWLVIGLGTTSRGDAAPGISRTRPGSPGRA